MTGIIRDIIKTATIGNPDLPLVTPPAGWEITQRDCDGNATELTGGAGGRFRIWIDGESHRPFSVGEVGERKAFKALHHGTFYAISDALETVRIAPTVAEVRRLFGGVAMHDLKAAWAKVKRMDPESELYKKLCKLLDRAPDDALRVIVAENIKWVSALATIRIIRRKLAAQAEGEKT